MQTHDDRDFRSPIPEPKEHFEAKLERRANRMVRDHSSQITAGRPGERAEASWMACGIHVTKLPDDEQGILRVSVGGGVAGFDADYCVFRGDQRRCVGLVRAALNALEARRVGKQYDTEEFGATPTPHLAQVDGFGVGQWCPTPDGTGKPEAVVIYYKTDALDIKLTDGRPVGQLGLRLKSRHMVNTLISILEHHRDEVFPLHEVTEQDLSGTSEK